MSNLSHTPHLFTPLQVREQCFSNRIVVSPMCQYSSRDGMADEWHLVHLGSRAVGGAGLVFTEATAVSPEGRISPGDLGIWKDEHIPGLKRIVKFVRAQGSEIGIQLAHAGRKASVTEPWNGNREIRPSAGGWEVVGPSAISFKEGYPDPVALTHDGIRKVVTDFREAAHRALMAGFRVVEVHAAHGYLLHQFLSPLSNHRTDEYGVSFENRVRLLKEVIEAVRSVWPPAYPLFVRISATDWAEGGWQPEDAIRLASLMKAWEVDVIDVSSGGLTTAQQIRTGPSYQVGFSQNIRLATGMLTAAVGMITDAMQAESILATGQADLVVLAREMLRDPYFPLRAARELGYSDMYWPLPYQRAK